VFRGIKTSRLKSVESKGKSNFRALARRKRLANSLAALRLLA
jgi:hypothetical protein